MPHHREDARPKAQLWGVAVWVFTTRLTVLSAIVTGL